MDRDVHNIFKELKEEISDLTSSLKRLEGRVQALKDDLSKDEAMVELEELKSRVGKLEKAKAPKKRVVRKKKVTAKTADE